MSIVLGALRLTEIMTDAMEGFVASPKIAGATNSAINRERPLLSGVQTRERARKVYLRPSDSKVIRWELAEGEGFAPSSAARSAALDA